MPKLDDNDIRTLFKVLKEELPESKERHERAVVRFLDALENERGATERIARIRGEENTGGHRSR